MKLTHIRTWQWKDCHWVRRTSVSDPLLVLQTGLWDEQSGPPVHAVILPMGTNPDKRGATKYRHLSMPLATVIALLHCSSLTIQYCTHWPRYDGLLLFCKHGKAFPKNNRTKKCLVPTKVSLGFKLQWKLIYLLRSTKLPNDLTQVLINGMERAQMWV